MATGDMHKKFCEDRSSGSRDNTRGQTDTRQKNWSHYFAPLPGWSNNNIYNNNSCYCCVYVERAATMLLLMMLYSTFLLFHFLTKISIHLYSWETSVIELKLTVRMSK